MASLFHVAWEDWLASEFQLYQLAIFLNWVNFCLFCNYCTFFEISLYFHFSSNIFSVCFQHILFAQINVLLTNRSRVYYYIVWAVCLHEMIRNYICAEMKPPNSRWQSRDNEILHWLLLSKLQWMFCVHNIIFIYFFVFLLIYPNRNCWVILTGQIREASIKEECAHRW